MANVYVTVETGLAGVYPSPSNPVRLDMVGFLYEPRVLGMMKGQTLVVRNGDDELQNVHLRSSNNPEGNVGLAKNGAETKFTFPNVERGIHFTCDVHPWMHAWLHVSEHPFFAVTGVDGRYSIPNLPAGEYEILAWHERFIDKPLVAKVKIEGGKDSPLDFTFEGMKR